MRTELSPAAVRARLAWLADHSPLETADAARERLAAERPIEPFPVAVRRRLADLRALCELSAHLHRRP